MQDRCPEVDRFSHILVSRLLATLLIYLAAAVASLSWPSAVEGVSHLYLATGFGLACILTWGRAMIWSVGLGSALVVIGWTLYCFPDTWSWQRTGMVALAGGIGAAAQAWLSARLIQGRHIGRPLPLANVIDILKFFVVGGALACTINATLCTTAMVYLGTIPKATSLTVAGTWWVGDTVGVLLGTPLLLCFIGKPQALWQRRRKAVAIPLVIATLLIAFGIGFVQRWEQDKAGLAFDRVTENTAAAFKAHMHDYMDTLETLRSVFDASENVTRDEFQRASSHWLAHQPSILALGWAQRANASELTLLEQGTRAEGLPQYMVFDLPGRTRTRTNALVVQFVEPVTRHHMMLGYNLLSNPTVGAAFEEAALAIGPVVAPTYATDWHHKSGSTPTQPGLMLLRAVGDRLHPVAAHGPTAPTKGAVFLVIKPEQALADVMQDVPPFVHACIWDVGRLPAALVTGSAACAKHPPAGAAANGSPQAKAFGQRAFMHEVSLPNIGQHAWAMTFWADRHVELGGWTVVSGVFGLAGVVLAGSLACLLLVVTGRNEQLHKAIQEAEQQKQMAVEASNAKSEFLSRMSHELRTPLNAMLGFAQVMELDEGSRLGDTQRARLTQIQEAGWHLLDMIDDVLDISTLDTGGVSLKKEPVAIAPLFEHCLSTLETLRQGQQVQVEIQNLVPAALGAHADPARLQQIFCHLLSNAIRYNRPGGKVHVLATASPSANDAQQKLIITFTDNGQGMSTEQLAQLFQPFNRMGRVQGNASGMGVGLVISRHLAQLMGGDLSATSQLGAGSVFTLSLPASPLPQSNRTPLPTPASPLTPGTAPQDDHIKHVLYVEDNDVNSTVMQAIVRERPHLRLHITPTIEEGLAALHDRTRGPRPDLILLDVHLPDASGLDLLQLLKANPDTQAIPVVMISADAMPEQIDACLRAGAACYLTKPVQVRVLLQQLDELLS